MFLYDERKPDPRFYLHACKLIGVEPHEAVFLDDIGMNLRAAKELGMETIRKFKKYIYILGSEMVCKIMIDSMLY